jgi:hypothetical protein
MPRPSDKSWTRWRPVPNSVGVDTDSRPLPAERSGKQSELEADIAMDTPPIVSPQEWESARQELLVKEKELTRAGDAMAALRRRMPWVPVDKDYEFIGPEGTAQSCAAVSLLNCR